MNFNLKKPCIDCPFVKGSSTNKSLAEGRIAGIVKDLRTNHTFTCHKTLEKPKIEQSHCAGALIFLEREAQFGESQNQMLQIAGRLGLYDRNSLDINFPNLIRNEEY